MARDAVTITALTLGAGVAEAAGTTISVANGATIAANYTDRLVIEVRNTNASDRVVTIPAGVGPLSGLGGVAVTVAATSGVQLICVESARHIQSDGAIHVDFAASFAGTIAAYRLPQG